METIGITIERNAKGAPTFARIDLRKYGEDLKDFFDSKGITFEKSPYDPEFVDKIKLSEQQIENGDYRVINTADLWQ